MDLVKSGSADAIVSAGHTGAAVAASTIKLRTLPGIERPAIAATMPTEKVAKFGENVPLGRAGQPVELAPIYVLLASDEASFVSGARMAVTGGRPML